MFRRIFFKKKANPKSELPQVGQIWENNYGHRFQIVDVKQNNPENPDLFSTIVTYQGIKRYIRDSNSFLLTHKKVFDGHF